MRRLKLALLLGAAIAVVMAPTSAQASPRYVTSEPANDAKMSEPPEEVRIVFDQPLDLDGDLLVLDACSRRIDDSDVLIAGNTISVGVAKTPSGLYTAAWRVKAPAGVGGGDATGLIRFTVTSGHPCSGHGGPLDHGNHGGNGGGNDHGGHEGHGGTSGNGDHSEHAAGNGTHTTHTAEGTAHAPGGDHTDAGHGGHGNHGNQAGDPRVAGERPIAAGRPTLASPLSDAVGDVSGGAVLAALLMSLALGAAGGWMIRTINL